MERTTLTTLTRLFASAALMTSIEAVAGTEPIDDPVNVTVDGKATMSQVGRAVKAALAKRGWTPGGEKTGHVEGTLEKPDQYIVKVGVDYDTHHAVIHYLTSSGLDYDEQDRSIHKNYNKWMRMLSREITVNLTLFATGEVDEVSPPRAAKAQPVEVVPVVAPAHKPEVVELPPVGAPPPAAPPVVPAAPASAPLTLRAGTTLRARALANSDELSKVAADTPVTRKGPVKNADGTWWYVTAGGASGWVLATDFK